MSQPENGWYPEQSMGAEKELREYTRIDGKSFIPKYNSKLNRV